jgi:glyoxylase-like metal-dependent hydrolase (beta-lactamase superfamily II)
MSEMQFQRIGRRGFLFPFKDPYLTNVYVVIGVERVYILDTSLGSDPMYIVKKKLEDEGYGGKPIVVFNSHGDYDHYWGNHIFSDALSIGHLYTRSRILEEGEKTLTKYREHQRGDVEITAPELVFFKRLEFPDDGITFFHTPGHTIDSSSCFDETDRVLFVGDNVESPLPYVYNTNIEQYVETLKSYSDIDWKVMIASHDPPLHDKDLLQKNIEYLTNLKNWEIEISKLTEDELHQHAHNIKFLKENLMASQLTKEATQHFDEMKKVKHH